MRASGRSAGAGGAFAGSVGAAGSGGVVVPNNIAFLPNAGRSDHAWFTNHIAPTVR
jgi:hypothetical protein